eukprot:TRINITY_DN5384_c0_g1_i1.p1 TRINITY_DN5384_c0_g1~~TRINITY_DN5384_c0_g1_i1.p1  ORF type:complete len:225 (-),score=41.41 TRINITY_DN5384_c0_g1_i1:79-696(-)
MDLMIFNLGFYKVGILENRYVLGFAGNGTFSDPKAIATAIEVFQHREAPITIIQQRTPVSKRFSKLFSLSIAKWIKECEFKQTLFIGSAEASYRSDQQLLNSQIRFLSNQNISKNMDILLPLEDNTQFDQESLLSRFIEAFKSEGINYISLIMFCSEGDNIPDAISMANVISKFLELPQVDWKLPFSWNGIQSTSLLAYQSRTIF